MPGINAVPRRESRPGTLKGIKGRSTGLLPGAFYVSPGGIGMQIETCAIPRLTQPNRAAVAHRPALPPAQFVLCRRLWK